MMIDVTDFTELKIEPISSSSPYLGEADRPSLPRLAVPPPVDSPTPLGFMGGSGGSSDHVAMAPTDSRLPSFMPPQFRTGRPDADTPGRKKRAIPAISLGKGLVSRYQAEKIYGIRRETGASKLKRLTSRHYEILARHLAGERGESISNSMGLSISTISRVLNDPLSQQLIKRTYKDRQAELDALAGDAIDSVRFALQNGSTSERLAAVDKYTKLKQAIAPETNPMETAEDYARAIVKGNQNVQINIGVR